MERYFSMLQEWLVFVIPKPVNRVAILSCANKNYFANTFEEAYCSCFYKKIAVQ